MAEKDMAYYWEHPEEYRRLTVEDLKNEPTLNLLEQVASDMMFEKRCIQKELKSSPDNKDAMYYAKCMKKHMETPFFEAISFGRSEEILKDFMENWPEKDVRMKMIKYRFTNGISIEEMAKKAKVGKQFLEDIEDGDVTNRVIAVRIGKAYELTEEECMMLIPENRREGSDTYDPEKYKLPEEIIGKRIKLVPKVTTAIDEYEHDKTFRRK